ncbi:MAG: aminotransferase class I/II-fold pyridoxal phosphate-dependent enzyme [Bacteroidia bacterium]
MKYKRMPIEIESPEQYGYEKIVCNLAESSVSDAVFSGLDIDISKLVLCYGDHFGKPELRELIASEYELQSRDEVLLTAGAAAALFIVATSLLEPSDHLVVMRPNYATNIETPKAIGCSISYLDLKFEQGFRPDLVLLESLLRPETKLISITCPNNPTGVMLSLEELQALIKLAERKGIYLLVDETYRDLCRQAKLPPAASLSDRVISVSSVSKAYGLPGIRLGWLAARNKALMELFLAAKEQIFLCNSVVDEEIAWQFMRKKDLFVPSILTHLETNYTILETWIKVHPFLEWVTPDGGVVCFPRIKPGILADIDAFYRIMNEKYGTFPGPGHWFDMDKRYMRIGYGWPAASELRKGLEFIDKAFLESKIVP